MSKFPDYFSIWHKVGVYSLRLSAGAALFFLILPILIIIPLSFNSQPYFTFTEGMLAFEANAYSLRWYRMIMENPNWILAIKNSFMIGIFATRIKLLSVTPIVGVSIRSR